MPDSDPLSDSGSTHPPRQVAGVPSAETSLAASRNGEKVDPDHHGKASDPNRQRGMIPQDSLRFAGAGLELAGSTIVLATLGYWLDRRLGNATPIAMALGGLLGFAAGMLRFVRLAIDVSRRAERSDRPGLALAKARAEREARAKLEALAENESRAETESRAENEGRAERAVDAGLEAFAEAKANFEKMTQTHSSESVGKAGRSHEND
jgi:F0F1-type ATP synthase assembly protein I